MKLKSIHLQGYKSIDSISGTTLEFGDITILLGANGAGKSNLVSFFSMLNYMMTGALQNFIAERGYADSFLYFGSKKTREILAQIEFEGEGVTDQYKFRLSHAAGDILIFTEELISYQPTSRKPHILQLNPAVRESDLLEYVKRPTESQNNRQTASVILKLLRNCRVFHFHDTSMSARVRGQGYIEDNHYLNSDGGNLAAFLFRLKDNPETIPYYEKIVRYIQKVMPQFGDFDLTPSERNKNYIMLNWRDKSNPQYLMGPHQISDGSLRCMCLAALLLQPQRLLPSVIILDEPELGLHPSAIAYFAGMVKSAGKHAQIVIATQSPGLVDEFDLDNLVIVERDHTTDSTTFERKNSDELQSWLEEYSLSELWEKNVIGGGS
ncbi:MAG: AAA family ATPase [Bacteroidia bacterium]|nr:AAA family ATPase [Bacteroidia bacterium]